MCYFLRIKIGFKSSDGKEQCFLNIYEIISFQKSTREVSIIKFKNLWKCFLGYTNGDE